MKSAGRPTPKIPGGAEFPTGVLESRRGERRAGSSDVEQRVTPLELFFDLVFVLSFTQVTASIAEDPTWGAWARGC